MLATLLNMGILFVIVYLVGFTAQYSHAIISSTLTDVFGMKTWNKENMSSKVTVRLIKKLWRPKGTTSDELLDEYPGTVTDAYNILKNNKNYEYIERPLSRAEELFTLEGPNSGTEFNPGLNSIIIAPPLFSHADEGFFSIPTIIALGMRNIQKFNNIFFLHMPKLNVQMVLTILREIYGFATRYEDMAEVISSFLLGGIKKGHWTPEKINFITYSYSANLAGYLGRIVHHATNSKLNSIICLDPYSAQYNGNLIQINKDDAETVHILHTSSYVQGTRDRIATVDFVFNDGFIQPECKEFTKSHILLEIIPEPFLCSHLQVVPRFLHVILFPSKFQARKCDTWPRFSNCLCEENEQTFISYPVFNRNIRGTFYLKTSKRKPFGLESAGSHCSEEAQQKLTKTKKELIMKMNNLK